MEQYFELGYFGLFLASFLAATILPFSSEVFFALMLANSFDPVKCLVAASIGNWAGGMTSYTLGLLGKTELLEKWFSIPKSKTLKLERTVRRYGPWAALLCWVPFVGDPIAVALGFFRAKVAPVAAFMFIGKTARYAFLVWIFHLAD